MTGILAVVLPMDTDPHPKQRILIFPLHGYNGAPLHETTAPDIRFALGYVEGYAAALGPELEVQILHGWDKPEEVIERAESMGFEVPR